MLRPRKGQSDPKTHAPGPNAPRRASTNASRSAVAVGPGREAEGGGELDGRLTFASEREDGPEPGLGHAAREVVEAEVVDQHPHAAGAEDRDDLRPLGVDRVDLSEQAQRLEPVEQDRSLQDG